MYKEASKLGLRFTTTRGPLSVEQLWQLNSVELSNSIKAVKKVLKKTDDDELSFLEDTKIIDTENQLRFNILKDVYLTKKAESDAAREASENKANNQKILALIAEKKDNSLKEMSVEQLEALLK